MKSIILLSLIFLAGCASNLVSTEPTQVTLCQVRANPKFYDKSLIQFKAQVLSDGLEGTALFDDACKSDSVGVDVRVGTADWSEINKIVYSANYRDTDNKVIEADFVAIFHHTNKSNIVSVMSIRNVMYKVIKRNKT